jgi:hypothetical protein
MTVQNTRPRTQHSAPRPQAALKLSSTASPGGPIWDSRHVKCGLLAQQRGRKYAESLPHILRPRSRPFLQRLADLFRHLAPSTGDCEVNSDSIQLLFRQRSLGPAGTIELSASSGRGFPSMLRHCHRACVQKFLVYGNLKVEGPQG